jgi:hypothetical protein
MSPGAYRPASRRGATSANVARRLAVSVGATPRNRVNCAR